MKFISFLDVKKLKLGEKSIIEMVINEYYNYPENNANAGKMLLKDAVYSGSGFFWKMHEKSKESYAKKGGNLSRYFDEKYEALAKNFYNFFRFSNALKVVGLENLESIGDCGCVLIANHKSALDPIYISSALKSFDKKIRWISKKENFDGNDLFKIFLEIGQVIPLSDERKLTAYSKQKIAEALSKKEALGIFPEGTRNKSDELFMFHTGAAKICFENNVPYVPVAVIGKPKPFKGKVIINIGKPAYLDNVCADYDSLKSASSRMRDEINGLLNFF